MVVGTTTLLLFENRFSNKDIFYHASGTGDLIYMFYKITLVVMAVCFFEEST